MNFLRSTKFLTFHLKFRSPLSCKFLSNPPFYFEFSLSRSFLGVSYKLFDKHFYFHFSLCVAEEFSGFIPSCFSRLQMLYKKGVLKSFAKITGKCLYCSLFLIKPATCRKRIQEHIFRIRPLDNCF